MAWNFKHQGAFSKAVAPGEQVGAGEKIKAGIFFKNRGQILGLEQDGRVVVDGARQTVPQAGLQACHREQRVIDRMLAEKGLDALPECGGCQQRVGAVGLQEIIGFNLGRVMIENFIHRNIIRAQVFRAHDDFDLRKAGAQAVDDGF